MNRDEAIKECINAIRQLWYDENNKSTDDLDARGIALHVGMKSGYIKAINVLSSLSTIRGSEND